MKKTSIRIISFIIVAVLVITLFYSVAVMVAHADDSIDVAKIITGDTTVSRKMTVGKVTTGLTVKFNFLDSAQATTGTFLSDEISMPMDSSFGWSYNTTLTIESKTKGSASYYEATLKNVTYNGGASKTLQVTLENQAFAMNVIIPSKYFNETAETDGAPVSKPAWHSTIVRNKAGQKLESVSKNTGPVTVEVIFYDMGLKNEGNTSVDEAKKYAYITAPTGFKLHNGSFGTVERMTSQTEYPRFKATFEGVESTGNINTLNFRVLYDFEEYEKSIEGEVAATLFQIKTESEAEETNPKPVPKIIISEYVYGKESIIAGEEFSLDLSFRNTSSTTGIENVDITIEPGNGFLITAASNTAYFPTLATNETKNFSVTMRANPAASSSVAGTTPTDYSVQIKFSYQYLNDKKYADGSSNVKISIPVTQLDRFGVDEITDYSQYIMLGEEGYVTVPITNKGKSSIYNITGEIKNDSGADFVAAPVHFGNLDAGKSGTVDISLSISTPGVFEGKAVVTYEDENMNQKEMSVPFSIMVMEPPPPQIEAPPDMQQQAPAGPGLPSIILCAAGALMMAVPLSLYIIKRVKAKGIEAIDEDY